MLIKRQRVFFLSRRLVLVFFFHPVWEMASVFMCKTSSVNHTVVLYCTDLCVSPLNFSTYQSAVAKERPGGPVVLWHVAVISGVHIRPVTFCRTLSCGTTAHLLPLSTT